MNLGFHYIIPCRSDHSIRNVSLILSDPERGRGLKNAKHVSRGILVSFAARIFLVSHQFLTFLRDSYDGVVIILGDVCLDRLAYLDNSC